MKKKCFTSSGHRCRKTALGTILAMALAICWPTSAVAVQSGTTISFNSVVENVQRRNDLLVSEDVPFDLIVHLFATKEITKCASSGQLTLKWRISRHESSWAFSRTFTKPGDHPGEVHVPSEPYLIVLRQESILDWRQNGTFASVDPYYEGMVLNVFPALHYFAMTGFNAQKQVLESMNHGDRWPDKTFPEGQDDNKWPLLPDVFENDRGEGYQIVKVEGDLVTVASEWDEMVFDSARGFALVKRNLLFGRGLPRRRIWVMTDLREVKPGLWLPFEVFEQRFAHYRTDEEEKWNKVATECWYRVEQASFKVPDVQLFNPVVPVGHRVADARQGIVYEVTKIADPFDIAVTDGHRVIRRALPPTRRHFWLYVIYGLLGGAGLTIAFFWWKNR